MSDESHFVQAVVARPLDDGPRLSLADWLDERGDARGAQLRLPGRWRVLRSRLLWDDAVGPDVPPAAFPLAAVPVCLLGLIPGCQLAGPSLAWEVYGGSWACRGCAASLLEVRIHGGRPQLTIDLTTLPAPTPEQVAVVREAFERAAGVSTRLGLPRPPQYGTPDDLRDWIERSGSTTVWKTPESLR